MAGKGRGRGRGRARAARHAPSLLPATSSYSKGEWEFEFIAVLNGDPLGIQRLLDKFTEFVASNVLAALQLRKASCGFSRWPVDVLFDGRDKMYLHTGWEKFSRFHDLQAGCVLTFSYQGDEEMSVKVFDDTSCRRHYHGDDEEDDD
nr:B3 domain-containing protein Os03g0212300-like [Lolium perenne]